MTEHLPGADWGCRTCDMPWPCAAARRRLAADTAGDELQLSIQMWTYHDHFVEAFPIGSATEAYARFVGWIRARDAQVAS